MCSIKIRMTMSILLLMSILLTSPNYVGGQAMSYVIDQGCLYMSHYIRDNYIVLEPFITTTPTSGHFNWATWTYTAAEARYMPEELTQALVDCGKEYAFYALEAPDWVLQLYDLSRDTLLG